MPEMCPNCRKLSWNDKTGARLGEPGVALAPDENGIWSCPECEARFTMKVEACGPNDELVYQRKVFTRTEE